MTSTVRFRAPLVLLVALVLQLALFPRLRVAGVMPDVMVLAAVAGGITRGAEGGAVVGFVAGIVLDLFLQTPLGLSALVFSLVGYGVGVAQAAILRSSAWIPVLTTLVASAAGEALFALAGAVLGAEHLLTTRLTVVVLVVAVINALLAPLAVRVLRWALPPPVLSGVYAP